MAERSRKKKETAETTEKKNIKVDSFEITRARDIDKGNVTAGFDMILNGIKFYSLVIVKGKNGEFISYPARKVDEDYFPYYWINLDQEDVDKIIDAVYDKIDEK